MSEIDEDLIMMNQLLTQALVVLLRANNTDTLFIPRNEIRKNGLVRVSINHKGITILITTSDDENIPTNIGD